MDLRTYLFNTRKTEKAFAKEIPVSRSHLNCIKRGTIKPSYLLAKAIQEATNNQVTIAELRGEGDKKNEQ
jgi:DNA-binding transcriptional regulator YdaS (Cro superfamily)